MSELVHESVETKKRFQESDRALVMISKEKDLLEKSLCSLERKKDSIEKSMSIEVQSTKKEMESLEKRLAMSDDAFLALAKEKEALEKKTAELQRNYEARTSDLDESRSIQARESAAWMESHAILKSSLAEKQNSLAKVLNEKNTLSVEKNALKSEVKEAMNALDLVSSNMAELEHQKTELESNLYAKLIESKGKHNEAISSIQSRLNQTERTLKDMNSEKNALERTVDNLRQENQHLSTELNESKSILSRESAEWQEEKIKLVDEKIKLTQRIYEVESTLINVCNQKAALESQKADIEREISTELMETKGKHNKKIAEIQVRLLETVS
jgi:chromosome segregation ATPase